MDWRGCRRNQWWHICPEGLWTEDTTRTLPNTKQGRYPLDRSDVLQDGQREQLVAEVTAISAPAAHGPELFTAVNCSIVICSDVTPCALVFQHQRHRETCCETLITFHRTTRRHILKDKRSSRNTTLQNGSFSFRLPFLQHFSHFFLRQSCPYA
jgi:hypothetical protein